MILWCRAVAGASVQCGAGGAVYPTLSQSPDTPQCPPSSHLSCHSLPGEPHPPTLFNALYTELDLNAGHKYIVIYRLPENPFQNFTFSSSGFP